MAYDSGFIKRTAKKIDAVDLLSLMCIESQQGSPSYNDLAARLDTYRENGPSRQAISKRFTQEMILFFQMVLASIIECRLPREELNILRKECKYKAVLVQDSTIVKLPIGLYPSFGGVSNNLKAVCNARIQGVYDLVAGTFEYFSIEPYRKNDYLCAADLKIFNGCLTLRDRGYLTTAEINRHILSGADFIYRYKYNFSLYDIQTGSCINLHKLLKKIQYIDMPVCLGKNGRQIRLVAAPVSPEEAERRRRKAQKSMKRHNPSAEVLALMGWTIFLTSVPKDEADFKKILQIYSLRWRIETIFKCWKSHMHFSNMHAVSEYQFRALFIARFIMIVIAIQKLFNPCCNRIYKRYNKYLSLLKFVNYLVNNPERIQMLFHYKNDFFAQLPGYMENALVKYCCYDVRKRINYMQYDFLS